MRKPSWQYRYRIQLRQSRYGNALQYTDSLGAAKKMIVKWSAAFKGKEVAAYDTTAGKFI